MQLQDFVNSMLWFRCLEQREFIGLESNAHLIEEYIIQKGLVNDFAKFMKEMSEQRFTFVTPRQNDKQLFCYIKDNPIPFSLVASTGTHSLELLYFWLKHLEEAAFVFVDEFDAFYHFKLSQAVCRKLFALDCQVFMTSHNTQLLTNDLLRPDCNFLLEKNKIRAFHDCTEKELREGRNVRDMILFVFEGKKREITLFKTLEELYFKNEGDERILCSFCNNIYNLYERVFETGEDIVSVVKSQLPHSDKPNWCELNVSDFTKCSCSLIRAEGYIPRRSRRLRCE